MKKERKKERKNTGQSWVFFFSFFFKLIHNHIPDLLILPEIIKPSLTWICYLILLQIIPQSHIAIELNEQLCNKPFASYTPGVIHNRCIIISGIMYMYEPVHSSTEL